MKTYYLVAGKDIKVENEDGSLNKLSNADILGTLGHKAPGDANNNDAYVVFDDLDTAVKIATDGQEDHPKEAFPIMFVTAADDANPINIKVDKDFNQVKKGGYNAYEILVNDLKFVSASLKHYSSEIADVVFDADLYKEAQAANAPAVDPAPAEPANTEQPAQTASKLGSFLEILKKMSPVFAIGTVGAGFWGSGAIPGVANLVSNIIGVTIPMVGTAGIISQVAIAAAVGALAYGAALGAWTVGKAAYNAGSTALANRKAAKSAKAQYEADKSATAKDVSDLEKALGYDEQDDLFAKFSALVDKAPDAAFEGDNLAAAQPKALTQLQVLQREKQYLSEIKAANDAKDEAKRQELEAKVAKRGFKFSS